MKMTEVIANTLRGRCAQGELRKGTPTHKQKPSKFKANTKVTGAGRFPVAVSPKGQYEVKSYRIKHQQRETKLKFPIGCP